MLTLKGYLYHRHGITLYSIDTHCGASTRDTFENNVGKGEIARNEQFLLFPQCFLLNQVTASPFVHILDIISLFAAELEEPKTGLSGKGIVPLSTLTIWNARYWFPKAGQSSIKIDIISVM